MAQDGIHWVQNIHTWVGAERVEVGIHEGWFNGVHVVSFSIHNKLIQDLLIVFKDFLAQHPLLPTHLPHWKPTVSVEGNCLDGQGLFGVSLSFEAHSCCCHH